MAGRFYFFYGQDAFENNMPMYYVHPFVAHPAPGLRISFTLSVYRVGSYNIQLRRAISI